MGRLVLRVRPGQRVRIDAPGTGEIWVGVAPGEPTVQLTLEGPAEVAFWREELLDAAGEEAPGGA